MVDNLSVAEADPFAQLDTDSDPFAQYDTDSPARPESSTVGAFARGAERSIVPTLTSLPAAGAGAEIGAAVGAIGGPVGAAVGGFVGGLAGMFGGAYVGSEAQDFALSKMPDDMKASMGLSDEQRLVDEEKHPYASQIGGLIPYLVTASPFSPKVVQKAETALGRFMQDWRTQKAAGGLMMGGWELGQEAIHDEIDWTKVAVATGTGLIFNHQNRIGTKLMGAGSRPVQRVMGSVEEMPPAPGGQMDAGLFSPREMSRDIFDPTLREANAVGVVGPGVSESTYMGNKPRDPNLELFSQQLVDEERAMLYGPQKPDAATITATARKMEPELFAERDALEEQATAIRSEIDAYRKPSVDQYNELRSQRSSLEKELEQTKNKAEKRRLRTEIRLLTNDIDATWSRMSGEGEMDATLTRAYRDLAEVSGKIREQGRDIAAAHRRAAETLAVPDMTMELPVDEAAMTGEAGIAPELFTGARGASQPAATQSKPTMTEAMSASGRDDRKRIFELARKELVDAGRPAEEADAGAQVIAARYVARAGNFKGGELGTPLELYIADHAKITEWKRGGPPSGGSQTPVAPAPSSEALAATETMRQADAAVSAEQASVAGRLPEAPAQEAPQVEGAVSVMPEAAAEPAAEAQQAPASGAPQPAPVGPKVGDKLVIAGVSYKIDAIDERIAKLTPTRKKDNAASLTFPRQAVEKMLADYVVPQAAVEGEKITLNGEVLDGKLAEAIRAKLAEPGGASAEVASGRLPESPDMAALRERMRGEALSDEYPVREEFLPQTESPRVNETSNVVQFERRADKQDNAPEIFAPQSQRDLPENLKKEVMALSDERLKEEIEAGNAAYREQTKDIPDYVNVLPPLSDRLVALKLEDFRRFQERLTRESTASSDSIEPAPIIQRVTTAKGTSIDVKPVVVEARDLLTSSDTGYDKDLQPRDRDRAASQGQIRDIATRLDPNRLGSSAEADRGAPIVGSDNMVESGNGRVMAIREAYRQNGEAAKRYREWIASQGIDVSKYNEPVLVRRRLTEMTPEERKAFTVEANQSATLAMSASERAMADARMLSPETLDLILNPDELGAIKNRGFVQAFVRGLPQSEQGMMATNEGGLSSEGLIRVKNAVLAKAYGDANLMARIAEATSDEIKSISNALTSAAPEWAKMRSDVEAGVVRADMDYTPELMEAVARTADLRSKGVKLDTFLAQQDAFDRLSPAVESWMKMFYNSTGRRAASAADIAERIKFYAQEARKVSGDAGLGFDLPEVRPEDVQSLAAQKGKENAGQANQANLFESSRPGDGQGNETRGGEAGGQGSGEGGAGDGGASRGGNQGGENGDNSLLQKSGKGKAERALGAYLKDVKEIWLKPEANPSTIIHESGHDFLEQMKRDVEHPAAPEQLKADMDTVKRWVGWKDGQSDFSTRQHEKFARGFERYFFDGIAPSQELAGVFQRFSNWLRQVYKAALGLKTPTEITPEIRAVFDRLLSNEPERVTVGVETSGRRTIADIHEAEAVTAPAERVGSMADRMSAERNNFAVELNEGVRNELAAAADRSGVGRDAAGIATAGENSAGGMAQDSSGRGAVARSSARGASDGSQSGGRSPAETATGSAGRGAGGAAGRDDGSFAREGQYVDRAGNIRLENLTNEESLRAAMREIAFGENGFIEARRGVISDVQALSLAEELGLDGAEALVNNWMRGQAFNNEEIMALRLLVRDSAGDVFNKAQAVKNSGGDWRAVRDYAVAKERHTAIQRTVSGATAEWGRAGRAFRNISGDLKAKAIQKIMRQGTGQSLFQLRDEANLLAGLENEQAVNRFIRDAEKPNFLRRLQEYWINGLISGPSTHTTYMVGNDTLALYRAIPETMLRAALGEVRVLRGGEVDPYQRVRFGEVWQQILGLAEGTAPALKAAGQSMRVGVTTLLPNENMRTLPGLQPGQEFVQAPKLDKEYSLKQAVPDLFGVIRGLREGVMAYGQALTRGVEGEPLFGWKYSPLGVIPNFAVRGVTVAPIGTAARLPSRAISGIHAFHRVQFYFMELNAEAFRMASAELEQGIIRPEDFDRRVADLKLNPKFEMIQRASETATEGTMMGQGGEFTRKLSALLNTDLAGAPLLKFIDPFVHITSQVIGQAIVKRTPVGFASKEVRADLAGKNGQLAQDKAIARMMAGTGLILAIGAAVEEGYITGGGPSDPAEAAVWGKIHRPYSVKIGDTWYGYHRLGVLGLLMGVAADMTEFAGIAGKEDMSKSASALLEAFYHNIFEESFLRGPSELFRAVENPDRYGPQWVRNFASSFTPYSVGMSQVTRAIDPYSRQARTLVDAFKQKNPFWSQDLYARRDLWGEPIRNPDAFPAAGLTAITAVQGSKDPVDIEMFRLNIHKSQVERKIMGVQLTDQEYDDYQRIAGRLVKMQLDQMVNSERWLNVPDGYKRETMEKSIDQNRNAARNMLIMKYPHIARDAYATKASRLRGDDMTARQ